ncbi:MAG: GrpB family protein [Mucilaginibacter sp.]|uniref:GrpB family protein n=1 Tax=Mucilaginibacter sp. TaxID=1882438 RepID=UPI0031A30994
MKITITEYQDSWPAMFAREKEQINNILAFLHPVIVHIGSTSVPGLCAKPIIDIMIGVKNADDLDKTIEPMRQEYTYVRMYEPDWPERRYFCRYKSDDGRTVPSLIDVGDSPTVKQGLTSLTHIHTFVKDTDDWIRHIAFRDYLAAHPNERDAYCRIKQEISKAEFDNMISYNDAKNDFVKNMQQKALKWYK